MEFSLPKGWTLRLTYYAAGDYDRENRRAKAGEVNAEFIPPPHCEQRSVLEQGAGGPAEEAQL
jgi:hypothetical protein